MLNTLMYCDVVVFCFLNELDFGKIVYKQCINNTNTTFNNNLKGRTSWPAVLSGKIYFLFIS